MNESAVSAIVLNYNGGARVARCVAALLAQVSEVVVVDNGSTDESAEALEREFGARIRLVRTSENIGISRGRNLGARLAVAPLLLFVDNDAVAGDGMVTRLREALLADPAIAIAGAVSLDARAADVVQATGPTFDRWGFTFDETAGLRVSELPDAPVRDVFYVPGAALLIAASTLAAIGGYDDEIFFGCEDVDICWRARLYGYRVVSVRGAACVHEGGGSIGFALAGSLYTPSLRQGRYRTTVYRITSREVNTFRIMLVNLDAGNLLYYLAIGLPTLALEMVTIALLGRLRVAGAYLRAFQAMARGLRGTLARRQTVQARRRVPDGAIVRLWSRRYQKLRFLRSNGVPQVFSAPARAQNGRSRLHGRRRRAK